MADDLEHDLADWLAGSDEPSPEATDEPGWRAPDRESANRLLRRVARLSAELDTIRGLAAAERTRINDWEADRTAGVTAAVDRLQSALEGFMRAEHDAIGVKTVDLPNGVLRLRAPRQKVVITDSAALDAWIEANNRWDLISVDPLRSRLAQLRTFRGEVEGETLVERVAAEDGTEVPGVAVVTPVADRFSATPRP
jgi:phage host-nuclease inhibitor protein Gam